MYNNSFLTVFYPHIVNFRNFAGCEIGYYDYNCTATCRYPSFGYRCQRKCNCIRDKCDLKTGCSLSQSTLKNKYTNPLLNVHVSLFRLLNYFQS